MASITRTDVECLAPEFTVAAVPDVVMDCYIEIAESLVTNPAWAGKGVKATALLTAHFLTLQKSGIGGGAAPVVEKKVGSVSVKFGTTSVNAESLESTSYGRLFILLRNSIPTIRLPFTTC